MKKKDLKSLTEFFFEAGTLRKIIRSHQQVFFTNDSSDSIASHSFRVTIIGYFLARETGADPDKVLKMCLLHDMEETRSGDQNWIHKKYVKVYDEEIRQDQLSKLPRPKELLDFMQEYTERKTLEAKTAKDADLLDQLLLLREYAWQGNKEAQDWLKSVGEESNSEKLLSTEEAKQIAKEIKKQKPHSWWDKNWTSKRR